MRQSRGAKRKLIAAGGALNPGGAPQPISATGNPNHPNVAHARRVDYAPLHAAMIRRDLWDDVAGLSEIFDSRLLEDADLSLKIDRRGRTAVFVPGAEVALHKPVTTGHPPRAMSSFKRKWPQEKQDQHPHRASSELDRHVFGHVLFIDQQTPRGDVDAGSYAALQEIKLFQMLGFKVSFLPLNLAHAGVYTRALQRVGVEVVHAPFVASVDDFLSQHGNIYDVVYVTRYQVARATFPAVRRWCQRAKVIFNAADLHFLRELRSGLVQGNAAMLRQSVNTREAELEVIRQADLSLSYSETEHAVIFSHNLDRGRIAKAPWVIVPITHDTAFASRRDVAFIGSFGHVPNVEAVTYFARSIVPALREPMPGVRFVIYGSQIRPEVRALETDGIVVAGHVEDVAAAYRQTRVMVAPLLSGAGVKGKVLEAMAHGVPCVLSPIAAEGLGAVAGVHYLRADDSVQTWVESIRTLYTDEDRWRTIADEAQVFISREYSLQRGISQLRQAMELIDIFPPETAKGLSYSAPLPPLL